LYYLKGASRYFGSLYHSKGAALPVDTRCKKYK